MPNKSGQKVIIYILYSASVICKGIHVLRLKRYKEGSVRNPSDLAHLVRLLNHEWKTLSQEQEAAHQSDRHRWPACESTCFPVFLQF